MTTHIHIIGMDSFNAGELALLKQSQAYEDYQFHSLLSYDELKQHDGTSFHALLRKAKRQLRHSPHPVDGIITFWDFPAQSLLPLLCKEFDLPGASIEEVEKCEHKFWARRLQRAIVPEATPSFDVINPFTAQKGLPHFPFPFWLKPINSFSSFLAHYVDSELSFDKALYRIRSKIAALSKPYDELLSYVDAPQAVAAIKGHHCIREAPLSGRMITLEGFSYHGDITIYGVIDSVCEYEHPCFSRYQYPSSLPADVQDRMKMLTTKLMRQLPYKYGPFNIEFFYDKERDNLTMLEVNPRVSQSHSRLFHLVDGQSHFAVIVDLALGKEPSFSPNQGKGKYNYAAKCFLRHHEDAVVTRVPDPNDIEVLKTLFPDIRLKIMINEGDRLSTLPLQDSYSYQIAQLFIGADSERELLATYRQCIDMLPFEFTGNETIQEAVEERYQPAIT